MIVKVLCVVKRTLTNVSMSGLSRSKQEQPRNQKKSQMTLIQNWALLRLTTYQMIQAAEEQEVRGRVCGQSREAKVDLLSREIELKQLKRQQDLECQIARVKEQEDEIKRQIAVLQVEGKIEKARPVDELYEDSQYSKLTPKEGTKTLYTEEMGYPRDFCQRPRTDNIYKWVEKSQSDFKQRSCGSSISDKYKQIGRSQTELVLNTSASPWEPETLLWSRS